MSIEREPTGSSLIDVIERVLDHGVVVEVNTPAVPASPVKRAAGSRPQSVSAASRPDSA